MMDVDPGAPLDSVMVYAVGGACAISSEANTTGPRQARNRGVDTGKTPFERDE